MVADFAQAFCELIAYEQDHVLSAADFISDHEVIGYYCN